MAKSPNAKLPLLLAVVLCALGGLAYWLEYAKKPKDQRAEADAKKVFALGGAAAARLEFRGASTKEPPGGGTSVPLAVALECESLKDKLCHPDDASKWKLVEPVQAKGDDATVNGLFKNVANLVANETIDLAGETPGKRAGLLKDYGLDAEARAKAETRRIAIALESGTRLTAYFGAKHPIGDNVFALLETAGATDETRVFVVPEWQLSVFDQKTSYFRDKNLFGLNEKEISAFTILRSRKIPGKLEAKRAPDGKGWILKHGGTDLEGDPDAIDGLLSGVARLAAKDIVANDRRDEAGKVVAGSAPTYEIRFSTNGGERRLRVNVKPVGPKDAKRFFAFVDDQSPIYELDPYAVEKLEKTLDELRIGRLIGVSERYSITAIDFQAKGSAPYREKVVKETGGQWKFAGAETGRGKIEGILDRLTSKVVTAYAGPAPTGDVLKATFLRTVDAKEEPVAEIEFWSTKGRLYARSLRAPRREIVELDPAFHASLPWKVADLVDSPAPTATPRDAEAGHP